MKARLRDILSKMGKREFSIKKAHLCQVGVDWSTGGI